MDGLEALVGRPLAGLVPVRDARAPLRVLLASLAPGGAERIVLEWLGAERARGRASELAVLHPRRDALAVPAGIELHVRRRERPEGFVAALAARWRDHPAPVSTHLITDDLLALLWAAGVRTIPTVHNTRAGWRNDPRAWRAPHVPLALACAEGVRAELLAEGCGVPVVTLRHRPRVGAAAFDPAVRAAARAELGIAPGTFMVLAVGALKAQKDYPRAVDVLAALCRRRDAALVIAGGILDRGGLAELDRVMERALRAKVAARLRLPGFAPSIDPWLAAADALLNVSRHEGLSMAVQEALAAGLPVVATDVGGQAEIAHPALELVGRDASARDLAARLARHPLRTALQACAQPRAPRVWSMATAARSGSVRTLDTLFVTANLNAGGAQRSLVNLARALAPRHRLAVVVCGESSHGAFASQLADAAIEVFRPAPDAEPLAVAESLLAHAQSRDAANLCFWNADPRVKLLAAKFAAPSTRVIDVSPGAYAFAEMEAVAGFAASVTSSVAEYYARLDTLVLKHQARAHPECARVAVIPNGVELRAPPPGRPEHPCFLVSGRIAPSKRLETVLDAFARVQRAHPAAVLEIVGVAQDRDRDYAAALVRAALGRAVRFRGARFDHAHLAEPYTATVVLGTHQGSPNAVLEAMAAGIAVIANDSGGTAELVIDGQTGWLLAEDVGATELSNAMLDAIARPVHAATLAANARERVRAHFSLAAMATRYLAILEGEGAAGREKMTPCNLASVPPAPRPSRAAPLPATAVP